MVQLHPPRGNLGFDILDTDTINETVREIAVAKLGCGGGRRLVEPVAGGSVRLFSTDSGLPRPRRKIDIVTHEESVAKYEYVYTCLFEPEPKRPPYVPRTAGLGNLWRFNGEARSMAAEAIEGYLEGVRKDNLPLPVTKTTARTPAANRLPSSCRPCNRLPTVSPAGGDPRASAPGFLVHRVKGSHCYRNIPTGRCRASPRTLPSPRPAAGDSAVSSIRRASSGRRVRRLPLGKWRAPNDGAAEPHSPSPARYVRPRTTVE